MFIIYYYSLLFRDPCCAYTVSFTWLYCICELFSSFTCCLLLPRELTAPASVYLLDPCCLDSCSLTAPAADHIRPCSLQSHARWLPLQLQLFSSLLLAVSCSITAPVAVYLLAPCCLLFPVAIKSLFCVQLTPPQSYYHMFELPIYDNFLYIFIFQTLIFNLPQ